MGGGEGIRLMFVCRFIFIVGRRRMCRGLRGEGGSGSDMEGRLGGGGGGICMWVGDGGEVVDILVCSFMKRKGYLWHMIPICDCRR